MRIKAQICVGLVGLAATTAIPAMATAGGVVMGCDGNNLLAGPRELLEVAPADCGNAALGGELAGISGARWRGWGTARATGTGAAVDGLGFVHPARFSVFRLRSSKGVTYYTRMRVVSQGVAHGGVFRRGVNRVVNVTPYRMTAAGP
jgi:hypothetical protein